MSDANRTGCGWYLEEDDEAGDPEGGEEGVVDQVEDGDLQPGQGSPAGGGVYSGECGQSTQILYGVHCTLYTVNTVQCTLYTVTAHYYCILCIVNRVQCPVHTVSTVGVHRVLEMVMTLRIFFRMIF